MIIVAGCECKLCGDKIYSRTNHDFKQCFCGNIFVDGGPHIIEPKEEDNNSYMRMGAVISEQYEIVKIKINEITALDLHKALKILFDDWNNDENKFGYIVNNSFSFEARQAAKAKISLI